MDFAFSHEKIDILSACYPLLFFTLQTWGAVQHLKRFACKCKERYCPQPTPPHPVTCVASHMCSRPRKVNDVASNMCASQRETSCCVASKMCASARNVTVPTPPHHLHSISHVFETKESQWRSIQHVCKSERNILLRSIKNVCKCEECYCPQPTPSLA